MNMDLPDDDSIEINLETVKQITFGGAIGMICGIAAKKVTNEYTFIVYIIAIYKTLKRKE